MTALFSDQWGQPISSDTALVDDNGDALTDVIVAIELRDHLLWRTSSVEITHLTTNAAGTGLDELEVSLRLECSGAAPLTASVVGNQPLGVVPIA